MARTCYVTGKYAESLWKDRHFLEARSKRSHIMENNWKIVDSSPPAALVSSANANSANWT